MIRCRIFVNSFNLNGKTEIKERKPDGGLVYINIAKVQSVVKEIFGMGGEGLADGDARENAILFLNSIPRKSIISICESATETSYVVTVYYEE